MNLHAIHDYLEIVFFISGIIVAIASVIGLYQLILTKRSSQLLAKRESFSIAAQQCAVYLSEIVPIAAGLIKDAQQKNPVAFGTAQIEIINNELSINITKQPDIVFLTRDFGPTIGKAMNALEGLSIFFTSGIADEHVAFNCIGMSFCSRVEAMLPLIVGVSNSGRCTNIMKLFSTWHQRIKKSELEQKKLALQKQCDQIKEIRIRPIGT